MFRGVLAALAPIVGAARVASATGKIVEALAVEIETAGPAGQSARRYARWSARRGVAHPAA